VGTPPAPPLLTIQSPGPDGGARSSNPSIKVSKTKRKRHASLQVQVAATAMGRYSVVMSASVHVVFLACSVTVSKSTEGKHDGLGGYDSAGAPFGVEVWKPDAHAVQTFPSSQPQGLLLTGQRLLVSQHFSTSTIGLIAQPGRWGWWWCGFVVAEDCASATATAAEAISCSPLMPNPEAWPPGQGAAVHMLLRELAPGAYCLASTLARVVEPGPQSRSEESRQ
jgi:hypothetical protein